MSTQPSKRPPAQRTTRRPTGLAPWPILLIAGAEKAGKSWSCAQASGSPMIGRTLWIGIGEDDPDEYAQVPGADFEIVPHDGTHRDILDALVWASAQPDVDGRPTLLVVDSMTRLWDLVCDMAQQAANRQAAKRNPGKEIDADITMNLWNQAKDRWGQIVDVLRAHRGPVLVTARLEEVSVIVNGRPTTDKVLKVKSEKNLPYEVGGIVQMPERGKAFLTGVRTTRMEVPRPLPLPDFTVHGLWEKLGLGQGAAREREHSGITAGDPHAVPRQLLLEQIKQAASGDNDLLRRIASDWSQQHDGEQISETKDMGGLQLLVDDLAASVVRGQLDAQEVTS